MPPGTYTVRFEADGYEPLVVSGVNVSAGGSTQLDVTLTNPASLSEVQGGRELRLLAPGLFRAPGALLVELPEAGGASLRVYDLRGSLVRTLLDGVWPAGRRSAAWDGRDRSGRSVPSGSYYVRLSQGGESATQRLLLIR